MSAAPPLSSLTRLNSTLRDLFIYIYDLSPLDLDLLFVLIKNRPMTLEDLVKHADRVQFFLDLCKDLLV